MKIVALNVNPGHEDIVGVATPFPLDDPNAHRLTLRTSKKPEDLDAAWMLTQFLTTVAPVIAEDGWSAALRRFVEEEWRSPTASLVLLEDPGNILGPFSEDRSRARTDSVEDFPVPPRRTVESVTPSIRGGR